MKDNKKVKNSGIKGGVKGGVDIFHTLELQMNPSPEPVPPVLTIASKIVPMDPYPDELPSEIYPMFGWTGKLAHPGKIPRTFYLPAPPKKWWKYVHNGITIYATEDSTINLEHQIPTSGVEGKGTLVVDNSTFTMNSGSINAKVWLFESIVSFGRMIFSGSHVEMFNCVITQSGEYASCFLRNCGLVRMQVSFKDHFAITDSSVFDLELSSICRLDISDSRVDGIHSKNLLPGPGPGALYIQGQRNCVIPDNIQFNEEELRISHRAHYGFMPGLTPISFIRTADDRVQLHNKAYSMEDVVSALNLVRSEMDPYEDGEDVADLIRSFFWSVNEIDPLSHLDSYRDSIIAYLRAIISRLKLFKLITSIKEIR